MKYDLNNCQWSRPDYIAPLEYTLPLTYNTIYNGHVTLDGTTSSLWYLCFIHLTNSKISIFIRSHDGNDTVKYYYLYLLGI